MDMIISAIITIATIMLLFPLCCTLSRELMELPIWEKVVDRLEKVKDLVNRLIGRDN